MAGVLAGVRAAIIDLDGTMLDTIPDFHVAINGMRAELDLGPITQDQIALMVGKGSENLIRSVLGLDWDAAGVEAKFAVAMDAYQRHYLSINGNHSALYPEVIEGLAALKAQGLRLACVTNKPISFTTPLLKLKGLDGFFEVVYGGDSLPRKKPDPAAADRVRRLRPGAGAGGRHRRLLERRAGRAGGRLPGADGALRLQSRTGYTRNRFRWYSSHAARSGTPDPFA
jgi:2-phosphoglycolate phosphatase